MDPAARRDAFGNSIFCPTDVFADEETVALVQEVLTQIFVSIGCNVNFAREIERQILETMKRSLNLERIETGLKEILDANGIGRLREKSIAKRTKEIADQVAPFVEGNLLLDLGCGNGLTSHHLSESLPVSITLADIQNYVHPDVKLPFKLIRDDGALPFQPEEFDSVLLLTVLHHCSNPIGVLSEAARVSRRQIIMIESVYDVKPEHIDRSRDTLVDFDRQTGLETFLGLEREQQRLYASVMDWFYNRVLENEVNVPNNFNTIENWEAVFSGLALRAEKKSILGFDQTTAPEFHVLYVLSRV